MDMGIVLAVMMGAGPVVVELYTSEGCSSCPPAEATVAVLRDMVRGEHLDVVFLTEHVDYWDHLGWKDPFSAPQFSARQRALGQRLQARGVYTPQLVVDGRVEFVGSDRKRATAAIAKALERKHAIDLHLGATRGAGDITIDVELPANAQGLTLQLAAVSDESTDVKAGENSGRTLAHPSVVRAMKSLPITSAHIHEKLTLPAGMRATQVVAFVESPDGVEGAAAVTF